MDASASDPDTSPIRVAEVTIAAYQWDAWRTSAEKAHERAHRAALALASATGVILGVVGLLVLPRGAWFSIVIYAPAVAAVVWGGVRSLLTRRGLAAPVDQVRGLVVPALVDRLDTASLVALLRQGATLVTSQSTVIAEHRRDAVIALVASEYDVSHFPAGGYPVGPTPG